MNFCCLVTVSLNHRLVKLREHDKQDESNYSLDRFIWADRTR
jgi:hypothetical protein